LNPIGAAVARGRRTSPGLSLVEILAVVLVLAVLVMGAIPLYAA